MYPLPGQIEFEGTALDAALTLAEPDALRLPGLQKGSKSKENCIYDSIVSSQPRLKSFSYPRRVAFLPRRASRMTTSSVWAVAEGTFGRLGLTGKSGSFAPSLKS